jgi:tetratricopeptide (TPR) repeat protein
VEHCARGKGVQAFLRLAVIVMCCSAGPATADQPWTTADLDDVADAAMQSITAGAKNLAGFRVVQLADALIRAGNGNRAKAVLVQTMSALDLSRPNERGDFVERLAQLGDVANAQALMAVDVNVDVRIMLLGKFGAGRAHAGDVSTARNAAKAVTAISEADGATNANVANAAQFALVRIGIGLSDAGSSDEALRLAKAMPAGQHKLNLLVRVAYGLCTGATKQANRDVAEEAANTARALPTTAAAPYTTVFIAQTAAETVALCNGAEAAKTFAGEVVKSESAAQVLSKVADKLTNSNEIDLARAVAPPPDPAGVNALLDAADRLKKQGDRPAATRFALAASQLALGVQRDPAAPLHKWLDHVILLGNISSTLAQLGAYDEAIAVVQPIEVQNRQQYYTNVVRFEVERKESAALARTLPLAIAALGLRSPAGRPVNLLYDLTRTLAGGGYPDEAKVAYGSLMELLGNRPATLQDGMLPWRLAVLKADLGDLAGALSDADNAGPMVDKPSGGQVGMLVAMQFANAKTKPTPDEIEAARQRAMAALGPLVAGPKASALSMIATDMAAQGKIDVAMQVASGLDVEPRQVLQSLRNTTLAAIARAQEKAGDPRGSLSTAKQLTPPEVRWDLLLKLAARPVK